MAAAHPCFCIKHACTTYIKDIYQLWLVCSFDHTTRPWTEWGSQTDHCITCMKVPLMLLTRTCRDAFAIQQIYTKTHKRTLLLRTVVINMAPASLVCERGESEPDATGLYDRSSASCPSLSFGVKTRSTSTLPRSDVNFPSWPTALHLAARYGSDRCRLHRLQDPVTGSRLCVHP